MKLKVTPTAKVLLRTKQPQAQPPNSLDGLVRAAIANNINKEFVKRMFDATARTHFKDDSGQMVEGSHYMEVSDGMAYPRIININGKLQKVTTNEAIDNAIKTGNFIKFNNDEEALYFTQNYKRISGLDKRL